MNGLRLVAAAPTPALRQALFGGDQNLDEGGRNAAAALAPRFHRVPAWVAGPARAAHQTAAALGGLAATTDALADVAYGEWEGRSLPDIDHALRVPADGIWSIEVAPLAIVRLTHRAGRWHLSIS